MRRRVQVLAAALSLVPVTNAQLDTDDTQALLSCTGPLINCLGELNVWTGQWSGGNEECRILFLAFFLVVPDYDEADEMADDSGCCDNEQCAELCASASLHAPLTPLP